MNIRRGIHYGEMGPVDTGPKGTRTNGSPRQHLYGLRKSCRAKEGIQVSNPEGRNEMTRE